MTTILFRYILRQLMGSTLLIGFLLLALLGLIQSLKALELMIKAQASLKIFFKFVFLLLPDLIIIILPMACFIGVMYVYHRLTTDREITASYATGFSLWNIASPALIWGSFLSVLILIFNLWILPSSFNRLRGLEYDLRNAAPAIFIQPGVFNSFDNIMIHVQEKKSASHLTGIIAYVAKPGEQPFTLTAEEGALVYHQGAPNLLLYKGNRQEINPLTNGLSILYFNQTIISLKPSKKIISPRGRKIYEMNFKELIETAETEGDQAGRLYAEAVQRILTPLYPLTFTCIVLFFLLLQPFSRLFRLSPLLYSVAGVGTIQALTLLSLNMGARSLWALGMAILLQVGIVTTSLIALGKHK